MPVQTYGGITAEQRTFYESTMLERLIPYLPLFEDGMKGTIPEHMGTQNQWRLLNSLVVTTTALSEGSPPSDTALSFSTVTSTVAQYGAYIKPSDIFVHQGIDPIWVQLSELLGEHAGASLHTVMVNALTAGTTVQYAAGVAGRSSVTSAGIATSTEILKAVRTLASANVPRFPDGYYHSAIHPKTAYDLRRDSEFKTPSQYGAGAAKDGGPNLITGEIGSMHGVRFVETTQAPIFAGAGSGGGDVYGTFVYGPRWYGLRDITAQPLPAIDPNTGRGIRLMTVPVETASKDDPLGQFGTMGWKCAFVCKVLQEARGVRIEHAVSS